MICIDLPFSDLFILRNYMILHVCTVYSIGILVLFVVLVHGWSPAG